jgi:hypothetical protein
MFRSLLSTTTPEAFVAMNEALAGKVSGRG